MAKRGFFTFGNKSRFDAKYNLPKEPEQGDTVAIDDFEITQNVMMYFVEPDNKVKDGEWLTGHFMHMFESSAGSGVVTSSILEVSSVKDLGVVECTAGSGEACIGVYQPLYGSGVPDEDDVCSVAISGIWETIFVTGNPVIGYFATVSSSAAGEGDDTSGAGTGRIGIWADNSSTYSSLWISGMERA